MQKQNFRMEFAVHYHEVNREEQATPITLLYYLEAVSYTHLTLPTKRIV